MKVKTGDIICNPYLDGGSKQVVKLLGEIVPVEHTHILNRGFKYECLHALHIEGYFAGEECDRYYIHENTVIISRPDDFIFRKFKNHEWI